MTTLSEQFPEPVIIYPGTLRERWGDPRPRRALLRRWSLWAWLASLPVLLAVMTVLLLAGVLSIDTAALPGSPVQD